MRLKKNVILEKYDPYKNLTDLDKVFQALIECLKEGDADAFKEILGASLQALNKDRFAEQAKIPRRTLFRILSPQGNPTLDTIARLTQTLQKVA